MLCRPGTSDGENGEHHSVTKTGTLGAKTLVILAILLPTVGLLACQRGNSQQVASVVVSYAPFQTQALLWTADEQGLFERNGLRVTLREYPTGASALDAVLHGEADLAVGPAEFPLVGRAFDGEDILILGSVDKVEHVDLVARRDRGILQPSDLRGRIVGTTRGTVAEFYLGRFLELNGVEMREITVVDLETPEEWENAVVEGEVDAVVTAQPHANTARDALGANATVWSAQSGQPMYALIVASREWTVEHPEPVTRFLQSLAQAEARVLRNQEEAMATVQRWLGLDPSEMDAIWSQNRYELSLDQSLITAMEDEARWMIRNDLTTQTQVPDFSDYVYEGPLKTVKPTAVTIIR